jgi:hypothetical protein
VHFLTCAYAALAGAQESDLLEDEADADEGAGRDRQSEALGVVRTQTPLFRNQTSFYYEYMRPRLGRCRAVVVLSGFGQRGEEEDSAGVLRIGGGGTGLSVQLDGSQFIVNSFYFYS